MLTSMNSPLPSLKSKLQLKCHQFFSFTKKQAQIERKRNQHPGMSLQSLLRHKLHCLLQITTHTQNHPYSYSTFTFPSSLLHSPTLSLVLLLSSYLSQFFFYFYSTNGFISFHTFTKYIFFPSAFITPLCTIFI